MKASFEKYARQLCCDSIVTIIHEKWGELECQLNFKLETYQANSTCSVRLPERWWRKSSTAWAGGTLLLATLFQSSVMIAVCFPNSHGRWWGLKWISITVCVCIWCFQYPPLALLNLLGVSVSCGGGEKKRIQNITEQLQTIYWLVCSRNLHASCVM